MAAITRQWWSRLVNAYEVKTGMVYLQGNNCVMNTSVLQRRASHNGELGYINLSSFLYMRATTGTKLGKCSFRVAAPETWTFTWSKITDSQTVKYKNEGKKHLLMV